MKYKIIRYIENNAFIAIIGGLFSLCLGGSVLSLIEFISSVIKSCTDTVQVANEEQLNKKNAGIYWGNVYKNGVKKTNYVNYSNYYDYFVN